MSLVGALIARSMKYAVPLAQGYAEGNMTATVRITRDSDVLVFDEDTLQARPAEPDVVYEGKGRLYPITGATQIEVGDEPSYYSSSYVSIPVSTPRPHIDDVVVVLSHPDPAAIDRQFRVHDVETGGQLPAVHRLLLTGIQPSVQTDLP